MSDPTSQEQAAEHHNGLAIRIIRVIGSWGESMEEFGTWLNNPEDQNGVWQRIGVMSGIFVFAVLVTVSLCIVTYWVILGINLFSS